MFSGSDIEEVITTAKMQGLSSSPLGCAQSSPQGPECLSAARTGGVFVGSLTTFVGDRAYWVRSFSFRPLTVEIAQRGFKDPPWTGSVPSPVDLVSIKSMAPTASAGDLIPADSYFGSTAWQRAWEFDTPANRYVALTPGAGDNVENGKEHYLVVPRDARIVVSAPTVTSTADAVYATSGDGVCDDGTITVPAGTYTLTLGSELGIDEDLSLTGGGFGDTIIQAVTP